MQQTSLKEAPGWLSMVKSLPVKVILRHMLTHTGVKNFDCLECGKKFIHKGNLNTHMLTHTGVRNFDCLECGKKFTRKGDLNRHMLTHTGVNWCAVSSGHPARPPGCG